jgi:hypothetical protein
MAKILDVLVGSRVSFMGQKSDMQEMLGIRDDVSTRIWYFNIIMIVYSRVLTKYRITTILSKIYLLYLYKRKWQTLFYIHNTLTLI